MAVTAEWLVDSIDGLTSGGNSISKEFVGIILLPIVGNAAGTSAILHYYLGQFPKPVYVGFL